MKIAFGSDHAGFELKEELKLFMSSLGHDVLDLGTGSSAEPADYPDFAEKAAAALSEGKAERAILICGSGVGISVAANKFAGIRAGLCHDTYSAAQGVEHDNINVLCLGSRVIGSSLAKAVASAWASAVFSGEERHARRLGKIESFERRGGR